MGKYSYSFKENALKLLKDLTKLGEIKYKKKKITNVRDLCKALDISSKSLYEWKKTKERRKALLSKNINESPATSEKPKIEKDYVGENIISLVDDLILDMDLNPNKIRFLAWLGGGLGISNANRLHKEDLLLKIGMKFIDMSGLVETHKNGKVIE